MTIEHVTLWPYLVAAFTLTALYVVAMFIKDKSLSLCRYWLRHVPRITLYYYAAGQVFFWALWFTSRLFFHFSWSLF